MSLDNALWIAGIVAEAAVVGLLLYRRVWRTLPFFCVYCAWALLSDAGIYAVVRNLPTGYLTAYLTNLSVDSALEFGVLVELAWSVLRPVRASLPRVAFVAVAILIFAAGAAIWPFTVIPKLGSQHLEWGLLMRIQQTTSILRVLVFLLLAGFSQLLSIGWRDRELQVATGLGFFSVVSLAVEMVHTHQASGPQYSSLNRVVIASYICSLLYWVFSFAQKEAERREFTPQMQNFLLAVAGAARADRIALSDTTLPDTQSRRKPLLVRS